MRLFTILQAVCVVASTMSLIFLANIEARGETSRDMAGVVAFGLTSMVVGSIGDVMSCSTTIFLEKDWVVTIDAMIQKSKNAKM